MKHPALLPIIILLSTPMQGQTTVEERLDWKIYFDRAGVHGCFLLHDLRANHLQVYNPARADSEFPPASTFKIFNSLVALETGVVRDENDTIRWDGIRRQIPAWNADQNMRSAIQYSTVWFYQELARRIGEARMQEYLTRSTYGNGSTGGGIDMFWLDGGLRITPRQQIGLLQKLYSNDLPFSSSTMEKVKEIIVLEHTADYVLRGKTGRTGGRDGEIGWFVGYLERDNEVYFFANNLDIVKEEDSHARTGIAREIFHDMGLMGKPVD